MSTSGTLLRSNLLEKLSMLPNPHVRLPHRQGPQLPLRHPINKRLVRFVSKGASTGIADIVTKPALTAGQAASVEDRESESFQDSQQSGNRSYSQTSSALQRYGWFGFALQLVFTLSSSLLLVFQLLFTAQTAPSVERLFTLVAIGAGVASLSSSWGYTRLSGDMRRVVDGAWNATPVKKDEVLKKLVKGVTVNAVGFGASMIALFIIVSGMFAQTVVAAANSSIIPAFLSSLVLTSQQAVVMDPFLFQSATNMLLGHFSSLACTIWLLSTLGEGHSSRLQQLFNIEAPLARRRGSQGKVVIKKGNAAKFVIDSQNAPKQAETSQQQNGMGGWMQPAMLFGGADIGMAMALYLRSARRREDPAAAAAAPSTPAASHAAKKAEPLNAAPATAAVNGSGEASSAALESPEPQWSPSNVWRALDTPPPPMNGRGPQWGSKIRVSTGGIPGGEAPVVPGASNARSVIPAMPSVSGSPITRGRGSSLLAARSILGLPPVPENPGLANQLAQRLPQALPVLPLTDSRALSYLDGSLPGDMGFDPLGLFAPGNGGGLLSQEWLRYSELVHGRWAMLGVVGCLSPEALAAGRSIPAERGVVWFKTGFLPMAGQDFDYGWDLNTLAWIQFSLLAFAEIRRLQDFLKPGSLAESAIASSDESKPSLTRELSIALSTMPGGDPAYPGGPIFNILDFVESEDPTAKFKEKEIKHGRLAMVAMVGFTAQALYTKEGPYQNLLDHVLDPLHSNVLAKLIGVE